MPTIHCPQCDTFLTVSPAAPRRLTCPNCLQHIDNPSAGHAPAPLRVLPIEDDVRRDSQIGAAGILVVTGFIAVGLSMLFTTAMNTGGASIATLGILGLLVLGAVVTIVLLMRKPAPQRTALIDPPPLPDAGDSSVLHYGRPSRSAPSSIAFLGQTIGGIVLGIGVAVLLVMALQKSDKVAAAVLAPAAIGLALVFVPRVRGLGVGLMLSMPVAFLILIGLCFAALAGMH